MPQRSSAVSGRCYRTLRPDNQAKKNKYLVFKVLLVFRLLVLCLEFNPGHFSFWKPNVRASSCDVVQYLKPITVSVISFLAVVLVGIVSDLVVVWNYECVRTCISPLFATVAVEIMTLLKIHN